MSFNPKIIFSEEEKHEISRMLRYIDFRNSQQKITDDIDKTNIVATTIAALRLSGYDYNEEQLLRMINDDNITSYDAIRVRNYYFIVTQILSNNIEAIVDELLIISFYNKIYNNSPQQHALPSNNRSIYIQPDLSEVVEWFLIECRKQKTHPLIISAAFIYEFVARDTLPMGKDEISHLLSLSLLQQQRASWISIYTPCRAMTADILTYHRTLKGRENIGNNISQWVIYWIKQVYEAAQQAVSTHAPTLPPASTAKKTAVNNRQRKILDFIEKNQPVKLADITAHLHKESINTVKKDLIHLRQLGYITSDGVLKGTVYYRN